MIEEFPPGIQLDLAALGLKVSPEIIEAAGREQRHAAIAAQIEELLPYGPGSVGQAQEIFASAQSDLGGASLRFGAGARGEASPLFRSGARIATQNGDERQALDLIERGLESAAREGAAGLTLGLLQERAWLYRIRDRAEQAEGLTRLGERARRQQDRPALLQYLAQSIDSGDPAAPGRLPVLGDLLSHADPLDAWGLVPALRGAVELAAVVQEEVLLAPLQSLVQAQGGPFQLSLFPDRVSQSALGALQAADAGAFARAFLRLCEIWPYRILFVAAPYGRGGEQLTEE